MVFSTSRLAVAFCLFALGCTPSKINVKLPDTLQATDLKPYGRTFLNNEKALELVSSAVHFGFSFEGKECRIYSSLHDASGHNYLQYEMDGEYKKRIRINGNATQPVVLTSLTEGKHTVWIYKATEAHTGAIVIQKVTGKNITALQSPSAPLIEFIGNSITCGAAADPSEVPCGSGQYHDQHNAYYAYGPRVGRELGANYILSSVSGIGAYRNWNSDGPTMPQVYEKVDFQMNTLQYWDFSKYTPKVVSIALGTNDFSRGDGVTKRLPFDGAEFVSHYIQFVQLVKSKYPKVQIALLSSPMMNGDARTTLENCLTAIKEKVDATAPQDKPVAMHFFQPMTAHGCGGHPNIEDHGIMAAELVPFFKKLLQ